MSGHCRSLRAGIKTPCQQRLRRYINEHACARAVISTAKRTDAVDVLGWERIAASAVILAACSQGPALAMHEEPWNALSLPTWAIHVGSVAEWCVLRMQPYKEGRSSCTYVHDQTFNTGW
jgi:hypothetical protein